MISGSNGEVHTAEKKPWKLPIRLAICHAEGVSMQEVAVKGDQIRTGRPSPSFESASTKLRRPLEVDYVP